MLKTNQLSLSIASQLLFKEVNISLDSRSQKKVALVGRNGCGKSSLLKVLNREIEPTDGSFMLSDENIGYLPQELNFSSNGLVGEYLEKKLEESWMDYKIDKAMADVGLGDEYLIKDISKLSGGEKVKVFLAGLLLDDPTILLLDEPTNNLDEDGVKWLENFIQKFRGSIVIVSHDRYLINKAIDTIWEIDPDTKGIQVFGGNYDDFLEEKKRLYNKRMMEYDNEERKIKETEKWLRIHEFHPKYRFSNIIGSKKQKLSRLKYGQSNKPVADPNIKICDIETVKHGRLLDIKIKSKNFGQLEILNDINFKVYKDDRILIKGKNGTGKTTLLNIVVGQDENFEGEVVLGGSARIGYLKQFSDSDKDVSILKAFEKATGIIEPKSRSILARYLFDAEKVMSQVSTLSYGQLKRLDLAIILAQEPNLLILDEPTNHLDIYTREELESFIIAQKIPMIIVSHDRYFVEKVKLSQVIEV